jgi:hypothetical protein
MKITLGALAAVILAAISWAAPAEAQGVPQGSYLRSCSQAGMWGDGLLATCRRADGAMQRSVLSDARRCVGDIGNNNGVLQCQHASGRQAFGAILAEPGYAQPRSGAPSGYGYGSERRYGNEGWERCRGLQREAEQLRARLDREWNPLERARTEGRLREVHEQQERCR